MIIRGAHISTFEDSAKAASRQRLLTHVERNFPGHWSILGPDQVDRVAALALERAGRYQLETERDHGLYLTLMLYLGSGFDTDFQLPWAAQILASKVEGNPSQRLAALFARAERYLDEVYGPGGAYLKAAVERCRMPVSSHGLAGQTASIGASNLGRWLVQMFPEKARVLGELGIEQVLSSAVQAAERYGIGIPGGTILCATMIYLLGAGFDEDPQFPWAAKALKAGAADPVEKVRRIQTAAKENLERWLSA